jgi:hypothetical protein
MAATPEIIIAGRLYRVTHDPYGAFAGHQGYLYVAEESGRVSRRGIPSAAPIPFLSVATGETRYISGLAITFYQLEEADDGDT